MICENDETIKARNEIEKTNSKIWAKREELHTLNEKREKFESEYDETIKHQKENEFEKLKDKHIKELKELNIVHDLHIAA